MDKNQNTRRYSFNRQRLRRLIDVEQRQLRRVPLGEPQAVIYNAGEFPANRLTTGMSSKTGTNVAPLSVDFHTPPDALPR